MQRLFALFGFVAFVCAGICDRAIADGGQNNVNYSKPAVTSGVVVRIEDNGDLVCREGSGKERQFAKLDRDGEMDRDGEKTSVEVNGREATLGDIKVGMRAQIKFYSKNNGRKKEGTDIDPLPMISINATSSSSGKPEK